MLTIFNRRELITVLSEQQFYRVRNALLNAGIPSTSRTRGTGDTAGSRVRGSMPLAFRDAALTYTIYVHRDDYHRAWEAIRPAL